MLPDAELQQVMHGWNDMAMPYDRSAAVHKMFEAQVARTPDAVAVRFGDDALTYAELDARANRLAHYLVRRGVGTDVVVGVCMHRSIDLLAALLGVMKAGGAYLPLDPGFPAERLAMMLEDAQPGVVLTHEGLLPDHVGRLDLGNWPVGSEHTVGGSLPGGDRLAYVLYTSGSTGRPKGVQVTRQGVLNLLVSMQRDLKLREQDRLLGVTTLSFDIAALELYLPLLSGACVVIASRETAQDPVRLSQTIDAQQITAMQATPSTWRMLVDHGWQPRAIQVRVARRCPALAQTLQSVPSLGTCMGRLKRRSGRRCRVFGEREGRTHRYRRPVANTRCTCSMTGWDWCRSASPGNCSSPATASPAAIVAGRSSRPSGLYRTRMANRAAACIAPAISCAGAGRRIRVSRRDRPPGEAARLPDRAG